jgi:hypothetical protein
VGLFSQGSGGSHYRSHGASRGVISDHCGPRDPSFQSRSYALVNSCRLPSPAADSVV